MAPQKIFKGVFFIMNTVSTPPVIKSPTRQVLFKYDEKKFAKTISRLTEDLLFQVKISVWSLNPEGKGKCINLLDCTLSESEFDKLAENAAYTLYEGSPLCLRQLGVV